MSGVCVCMCVCVRMDGVQDESKEPIQRTYTQLFIHWLVGWLVGSESQETDDWEDGDHRTRIH